MMVSGRARRASERARASLIVSYRARRVSERARASMIASRILQTEGLVSGIELRIVSSSVVMRSLQNSSVSRLSTTDVSA